MSVRLCSSSLSDPNLSAPNLSDPKCRKMMHRLKWLRFAGMSLFQGLVLVPRHGYRVIRKQAWLISGFCGTIRLLEKRHAMHGIEMHGIEL